MKRKGRQTQLATGLDRLAVKFNKVNEGALDRSRVATAWGQVAGETVSGHTTGAHLRQGELLIYVDSPVWATELSALSEPYRVAINEHMGRNLVRSVRFAVSRKVEQEREWARRDDERTEFYAQDKVESVPLTDNERAQVEASAKSIPDAELREAVIRATVADLEWKKGIRAARSR